MDTVKICKLSDGEIMTGRDVDAILSLPKTVMSTLLLSALYEEKGRGSRYVTYGFEFKSWNPGRNSLNIGPGVAVLHNVIVASEGNHDHFIVLDRIPEDDDVLYLTPTLAADDSVQKLAVDDLTPMESTVDRQVENQITAYPTWKYLPKFSHLRGTDFADDRYSIPYRVFVADDAGGKWIPARIQISTLPDHREAPTLDHPDESVTQDKLSLAITGQSARKKTITSTLKVMSDMIFDLRGKLPGIQRIGGQISDRGEWVTDTPGYHGIDDIFYALAKSQLQKGRSFPHDEDVPWQDYIYDSEYTPCIGWIHNGKFKLNPAAFLRSAPGSVYCVRVGTNDEPGYIYIDFTPANSIPAVDPPYSPNISEVFGFASIRNVKTPTITKDTETIIIECSIVARPKEGANHSSGWDGRDEMFIATYAGITDVGGDDYNDGSSNYMLIGLPQWRK